MLLLSAVIAVFHLAHPEHSWSKSSITNTPNIILKPQLVIRHNRKGHSSAKSFVCTTCKCVCVWNPVTEALRASATEPLKTNYTLFSCSYIHSHLSPLLLCSHILLKYTTCVPCIFSLPSPVLVLFLYFLSLMQTHRTHVYRWPLLRFSFLLYLLIKDRDDCGRLSKGGKPCASASPGWARWQT